MFEFRKPGIPEVGNRWEFLGTWSCSHAQLRRTTPPVPRGCASVAVRLIKLHIHSSAASCGGWAIFGQCTLKVDYLENSLSLGMPVF